MTLVYDVKTADSQTDMLSNRTGVFLVQNDLAAQLMDSSHLYSQEHSSVHLNGKL